MSQDTHSLSPPVTYYVHSSKMYERMLEMLPSAMWNELHDEVEKTYRHLWDLKGPIVNNEVQFEFNRPEIVPHSRNFCNETKWAIKTQSHDKFCSKCGCQLPKFEGEEE